MANFLSKLFGTKSQRDLEELQPYLAATKKVYPEIQKLDNDALRAKTDEFKARIREAVKEEEKELVLLSLQLKTEFIPTDIESTGKTGEALIKGYISEVYDFSTTERDRALKLFEELSEEEKSTMINALGKGSLSLSVDEKIKIYKRIDKLEKELYDKTQQVLNDILPEAFAVVKETARRFAENEVVVVTANDHDRELAVRCDSVNIVNEDGVDKAHYNHSWMAGGNMITWDMVHYDVQILGGAALHGSGCGVFNNTIDLTSSKDKDRRGNIAEMATGEGKTLVATLPVYLNALPGKGVHVVTVNDYLARRDSEWMGMLFEFHGLSVDCIDKHEPHSDARKAAYNADITYGTNNEFGFDYLRDNMSRNPDELVQRGHNYAIVDEVDSVLIDDARTPLIISGPTGKDDDDQEFNRFKPVIKELFDAQLKLFSEILTDAQHKFKEHPDPKPDEKAAKQLLRAYRGLPKRKALIKFLSEDKNKLLSETGNKIILQRTENYYMKEQNKNMFIIDNDLSLSDKDINDKIRNFNESVEKIIKEWEKLDKIRQNDDTKDLEESESPSKRVLDSAVSCCKDLTNVLKDCVLHSTKLIEDEYKSEDEGCKLSFLMKTIDTAFKNYTWLHYFTTKESNSEKSQEIKNDETIKLFETLKTSFDTQLEELEKSKKQNNGDIKGVKKYEKAIESLKTIKSSSEYHEIEQSIQELRNNNCTTTGIQLLPEISFGHYGLFFIVDEKNRQVELTERGMDFLTSKSRDRNFYQLPDIGSKIAELEAENLSPEEKAARKEKLYSDFAVQSDRVHTVDQLLKAYTLFEKDVDYIVTEDNQVKIVDEQTGRIMEGRRWSDGLHQAVEAKENANVEAATQTYATITLQNYFRMYNKLAGMTGTAETEAGEFWDIYKLDVITIPTDKPIQRIDMDDMIYKTKREKYKAVIDEVERLIGEGRPVLVGTTSVETSELLDKMLKMKRIDHSVLNAKQHQKEAEIVAHAGEPGHVTIATNMAGRGTDIKLKGDVREKGGLAIIGTERHESRRVDRQLRGRAGRQGDPGSSIFFVSLEDNLMRIFGSERIASIMDRMGLQEGEVIQSPLITKQIEKAQKKVEENNFGMRKRLLEYDDVMNNQRTVIYNKRRNALYGDRLSIDISNMFYDTVELLYNDAQENHDFEAFKMEMIRVFALDVPFSEKELFNARQSEAVEKLYNLVYTSYKERMQRLCELAFPFIKRIYENTRYVNVAFPITDGKKTLNVVTPVKKSYDNKGREVQLSIEKGITLAIIDDLWKDHLRELDDLKTSVQNASYEQKDPLLIYKFESFKLFEKMLLEINREISSFLSRASLPVQEDSEVREARQPRSQQKGLKAGRDETATQTQRNMDQAASQQTGERPRPQPVRVEKKVGRNDPCPCGSGKKYKNCCGKEEN